MPRRADRVTRPSRERVADAIAAKAYLQSRADVKPAAVSLLGWSNGGSTVLYAVDPRRRPQDGKPDFAKAVAFYPGCATPAESGRWQTRLPLLILIGAADDWTPAKPCSELVKPRPEIRRTGGHHALSRRLSRFRPPQPAGSNP